MRRSCNIFMSLRLRSFVIGLVIFLVSGTIFSIVSSYKSVKASEVTTSVKVISPPSPSGASGGVAPTPTPTPTPISEVAPVKEVISISEGGEVSVILPEKTKVTVEIPPEAVPVPEVPEIAPEIEITITSLVKTDVVVSEPVTSILEDKRIVGNYVYEFSTTIGGVAVEVFEKPVTLKFTYTAEQVEGLDEDSLTANYWDEIFLEWIPLPTVVDTENKIVTAFTTHFTYYIVMADIIVEKPPEEKLPEEKPIWEIIIKEIKAKIAEISAQIAILQAKTVQLRGEIVYEGISADFTFSKFLKRGSKNDEVKYLQIVLRKEVGEDIVGTADGIFGPKTYIAVKEFQEKQGLVVDGIVGKNTRAELNKLLGK